MSTISEGFLLSCKQVENFVAHDFRVFHLAIESAQEVAVLLWFQWLLLTLSINRSSFCRCPLSDFVICLWSCDWLLLSKDRWTSYGCISTWTEVTIPDSVEALCDEGILFMWMHFTCYIWRPFFTEAEQEKATIAEIVLLNLMRKKWKCCFTWGVINALLNQLLSERSSSLHDLSVSLFDDSRQWTSTSSTRSIPHWVIPWAHTPPSEVLTDRWVRALQRKECWRVCFLLSSIDSRVFRWSYVWNNLTSTAVPVFLFAKPRKTESHPQAISFYIM